MMHPYLMNMEVPPILAVIGILFLVWCGVLAIAGEFPSYPDEDDEIDG